MNILKHKTYIYSMTGLTEQEYELINYALRGVAIRKSHVYWEIAANLADYMEFGCNEPI